MVNNVTIHTGGTSVFSPKVFMKQNVQNLNSDLLPFPSTLNIKMNVVGLFCLVFFKEHGQPHK